MVISITMDWFGAPVDITVSFNYEAGEEGKLDGPWEHSYPPVPEHFEITSIHYQDNDVTDLLLMPRVESQLKEAIQFAPERSE